MLVEFLRAEEHAVAALATAANATRLLNFMHRSLRHAAQDTYSCRPKESAVRSPFDFFWRRRIQLPDLPQLINREREGGITTSETLYRRKYGGGLAFFRKRRKLSYMALLARLDTQKVEV